MASGKGAYSGDEYLDAFIALVRVEDLGLVERLIEEHPVIGDPGFIENLADEAWRGSLKVSLVGAVVQCLHGRLHDRLAAQVKRGESLGPVALPFRGRAGATIRRFSARGMSWLRFFRTRRVIPQHYRWLLKQSHGVNLDLVETHLINSRDHRSQLLRELGCSSANMPVFAPIAGSRWAVVVVRCLRCSGLQAAVRCLFVDAFVSPQVAKAIANGTVNEFRCRMCNYEMCEFVRPWVLESPRPSDILGVFACLVLKQGVRIFKPPKYVIESAQHSLMEVMAKLQAWDSMPQEDENLGGAIGTVYSIPGGIGDFVVQLIDVIESEDEAMGVIETIGTRLSTAAIGLEEATREARCFAEEIGPDYEPSVASYVDFAPHADLFVAHSLVNEQVATVQGAEPISLAVFAVTTASSLMMAGRRGQSAAALERAARYVEQAGDTADPAFVSTVEMIIKGCHGDLHSHAGNLEKSELAYRDFFAVLADKDGAPRARLHYLRQQTMAASRKAESGMLGEALTDLCQTLRDLEELSGSRFESNDGLPFAEVLQYAVALALGDVGTCLMELCYRSPEGAPFAPVDPPPFAPELEWFVEFISRQSDTSLGGLSYPTDAWGGLRLAGLASFAHMCSAEKSLATGNVAFASTQYSYTARDMAYSGAEDIIETDVQAASDKESGQRTAR